jgi:pimeloyl-ACP methyl ester carboxylesterase
MTEVMGGVTSGTTGAAWALGECQWLPMNDGARIAVRRTGNPRGPRVVLGHGNGFAIDAFASLTRELSVAHECFALDLRNHGKSSTGRLSDHTPGNHQCDIVSVMGHIDARAGVRPKHGVFHSISGVFAVEAQLADGGLFASLILMEPPLALASNEPLSAHQAGVQTSLAVLTERRRSQFATPAVFADRLRGRAPFERLSEPALRQYAASVLRRDGSGDYTLACPPAFEAALYASNRDRGTFALLPKLSLPGLVLASARVSAQVNDSASGLGDVRGDIAAVIAGQAGFEFMRLPNVSHLMPMEAPETIAAITSKFISSLVGGTTSSTR